MLNELTAEVERITARHNALRQTLRALLQQYDGAVQDTVLIKPEQGC